MAPTVRFLHSEPQHEVSSLLQACFSRCRNASIVAGFVTPDGIKALKIVQGHHASKLVRFVVGAGTYKSFIAVDQLISAGTALSGVRIHLGHSQPSDGKKNPFRRYHPMLHSKVYLFEMDDGSAVAFVGSHNMTGFALRGLNGEAGLLIEGAVSEPIFREIRQHIDEAFAQAIPYEPSMKEAYAWWTKQYVDGLGVEANDAPRDAESKRTVVILAQAAGGRAPVKGQVIYFEISAELSDIRSLGTEVHVHVFDTVPSSPAEALSRLREAKVSLSCKTEGLEMGQGSVEVAADWSIDDRRVPLLKEVVRPFRPATSSGMQQVRVRVTDPVQTRFDYLFDSGRQDWAPEFDLEDARGDSEIGRWHRVKGISEGSQLLGFAESTQLALPEVTPQSGSFVLLSRRRRRLSG